MIEEKGQEDRQHRHGNAGDDSDQAGDQADAGWHDEHDDEKDNQVFGPAAERFLGLPLLEGLANLFWTGMMLWQYGQEVVGWSPGSWTAPPQSGQAKV